MASLAGGLGLTAIGDASRQVRRSSSEVHETEEVDMTTSTASGIAPRVVEPGPAVHDFDFLPGTWRVHHRRLTERLAGGKTWEEFEGTSTATAILGGAGNLDDNILELPAGTYRAITMRAFDPTTDLWSIWWLDGRSPGQLDPPVVGGFIDGVGAFIGPDTFGGRPILVRLRWFAITDRTARWDQSFSDDDGATWEVNWEMWFERTS